MDLVPVYRVMPERRPGDGAVIVLRDGSFRLLLRAGAINFEMKSPAEQAAITYAFGEMVNTLDPDFRVQIASHAKALDVDAYARQFEGPLASERTPAMIRRLIEAHIEHFESQVKVQHLLQRELYVVISWKVRQGPVKRSFSDDIPLSSITKAFTANVERKLIDYIPDDLEVATAIQRLDLRADQIGARLENLGISVHRLDDEEVKNLLFDFYHPSDRTRAAGNHSDGMLMPAFSAEAPAVPRRPLSEIYDPPRFD